MEESEIIYVATNVAMPDYVKIGKVKTPNKEALKERISGLSNSSVPFPFKVFCAYIVPKKNDIEKKFHEILTSCRVSPKREFFSILPEQVEPILEIIGEKIVIEDDVVEKIKSEEDNQEARDVAVKAYSKAERRGNFDFLEWDVPIGAEIELPLQDGTTKTARVISRREIEMNGKKTSVSRSAKELLNYKSPVSGTLHWKFKGETLNERRKRMENEDDD